MAPEREWRLICVDSCLAAVDAFRFDNSVSMRSDHIDRDRLVRLLDPSHTVMDLNIGAAIWLAARAEGYLHPSRISYKSDARIVFVGHGADEHCVGYARHRTKFGICFSEQITCHVCRFREGGWARLQEQLELEMRRLWSK